MRVATFGYQTWGHKTLEALIKSNHEIVLAVTHPPSDQPYESIWADSVEDLARSEGILPALESSHAVAKALELAAARPKEQAIVVCLSGRGDKDAFEVARLRGETI